MMKQQTMFLQEGGQRVRRVRRRLHVLTALLVLSSPALIVGCTTEPDQSLVGFWHVVDINGSFPVPNVNLTQVLLELRPDSTWAEYYNGVTTPDDGGVWTVPAPGKISLTGDYHGEGFISDGKLTVEWDVLDVYHYRRGRE